MKKILFVAVLATALVFAFGGVAMAKYAGYAYNNPVVWGPNQGPNSSDTTVTIDNPTPGYLSWEGALTLNPTQSGPHGGYTATTVKCAVCHSVHRAQSDNVAAGVGDHNYLTAASASCTACHTTWGSNPSSVLVEYAVGFPGGGAGPHAHYVPNCMGACHAGVHGAGGSDYAVAQRFLLSPNLDESMTAAVAAGNVRADDAAVTAATLNSDYALLTDDEDAAANRAMVTGYLCAQSGCHTSSQFAVNAWGYAETHASDPADNATLDQFFTGHATTFNGHGCGNGCHQVAGNGFDSVCATCHDMVGVATNSTAFPHGNRAIDIYEYTRPGAGDELTATVKANIASGNLWMYAGDATHRDGSGEPTTTAMWNGVVDATPASVGGYSGTRVNTRTLIEGAAGFHDPDLGNINDGTCLKCHGYGSAGDGYWPHHGDNPTQDFSSK